jgi:hypothetical protein
LSRGGKQSERQASRESGKQTDLLHWLSNKRGKQTEIAERSKQSEASRQREASRESGKQTDLLHWLSNKRGKQTEIAERSKQSEASRQR